MKRVKAVVLIIFSFILVNGAAAQDSIPGKIENNGLNPYLSETITDYISKKMEKLHSPGLGVGIVKGDRLVYAGYFGYADIEDEKPVTEDTMFRIGSISKTFTAIGLMQQWEQGKFKLDDDINKYFPEPLIIPPHPETNPVTFRRLLTHTSGGGEFLILKQMITPGFGVTIKGDEYPPLAEVLEPGMRNKVDPGLKWAYCNYCITFLGYALENMAGEPFHIYMEENVFEPLGMRETSYHHDEEIMDDLSTGYRWEKDKYVVDPHRTIHISPAGSIYTNIPEMSRYVTAILNGGKNEHGSVIKPETLKMMMDTQYTLDERQSGLGLVFMVHSNNFFGHKVVGHGGAVPWGHTSNMLLCPEGRLGVFVFANSGTRAPREISWGIMKILLGVKEKPLPEIKPDKKVWSNLVGLYGPEHRDFNTDSRLYAGGIGAYKVSIIDDELKLVFLWKGKKEAKTLKQVSENDPYFYQIIDKKVIAPQYVSFKIDESGKAEYIIPGGLNEYKKMTRSQQAKASFIAVPGRIISSMVP